MSQEIFKVSKTRRGFSIKNMSNEKIKLISAEILYYYTISSTKSSSEEYASQRYGRKLDKEVIHLGREIGPGEVIEIEFHPPELIESIKIFYESREGIMKNIVLKPS
ncbi:MAG: hypothetical protein QXJ51_04580 [Sulfolobales archaeon]